MVRFRGDLLLGGAAIRDLDGTMAGERWTGQFAVPRRSQSLLETGRPYLLLLDDGRSGQVMLTRVNERPGDVVLVEFQGMN